MHNLPKKRERGSGKPGKSGCIASENTEEVDNVLEFRERTEMEFKRNG